jgi:hypothetical protein
MRTATLAALQRAYDDRAEPEPDDDTPEIEAACDDAIALIGRALRALLVPDKAAAADLLRESAALLGDIADEVTP